MDIKDVLLDKKKKIGFSYKNFILPYETLTLALDLEFYPELNRLVKNDVKEMVVVPVDIQNSIMEDEEKYGVLCSVEANRKHNMPFIDLTIRGLRKIIIKEVETVKSLSMEPGTFITVIEEFEYTNDISKEVEQKYRNYLVDAIRLLSKKVDPEREEFLINILENERFDRVIYYILSEYELIGIFERYDFLKINTYSQLFEETLKIIKSRQEFDTLDRLVEEKVKENMLNSQKNYYLKEKINALYEEMGEGSDDEIRELELEIVERELPEELKQKLLKETARLKKTNEFSAEAGVIRTYLDNVLSIPWEKEEAEDIDIVKAEKILNDEHSGLEEVKNTILEHLAVTQLNKDNPRKNGNVLCLIGPPGIGKTSLGESIAHAMGRNFEKIALGGVSDEADIRGHRKTYVGAMPGRIIEALKKAGTSNPVILLDEVDKIVHSYKGDPSAALLEVLDPVQNKKFKDHYVEFEYDLSDVFFVCTANSYQSIPTAIIDRMEVISLDSYTVNEKLQIAKNYLLKQATQETNIKFKLSDAVILDIIDKYTSEAGVRNLKRRILKIFRKIAKIKLENPSAKPKVTVKNLEEYLGVERYKKEKSEVNTKKIGVVKGLAWTMVGGMALDVEAVKMEGKGNLQITGRLGEVMKESSNVAYTYVRANYDKFGIENSKFYLENDVHLHFPEGATPKDGPSAGITITTAIISALSNKPVRQNVAMTGEVTITGEVLAIGGVKEKILGGHRLGIREFILPYENISDTKKIPEEILKEVKIHFVKQYTEVANIVFGE